MTNVENVVEEAVEQPVVKFKVGDKEVSKSDYIKSLHDGHLSKKGIIPEAVSGFRVGKHMDLAYYSSIGFEHPRDHDYYDPANNNPEFMAILEGIRNGKDFDNAIVVYPYEMENGEWELLVLDGATRLSCAGIVKGEDPDTFRRVDAVIFKGNEIEAKAAMVRRNMSGRNRSLSDPELVAAIRRFDSYGWTVQEICERLGQTEKFIPKINSALVIGERLIPELLKRFEDGDMKFTVAKKTAEKAPREQKAILKDIQGGKKVKVKNVDTIQKPETIVTRMEDFLNDTLPFLERTMEKFKIKVNDDKMAALMSAMSDFISDIDRQVQSMASSKTDSVEIVDEVPETVEEGVEIV